MWNILFVLAIANFIGHLSDMLYSGYCPEYCPRVPENFLRARFNMATRKRNDVDYKQLDNISSVVLYNTAPKRKRKTLLTLYIVERIISKRRTKNVSKNLCEVQRLAVSVLF
jgi:hypothetical protein